MGMKYYAKSKKNGLSDKERGKQIKEPEEEQKTLNSHQEDIVRCAEAFFEEYLKKTVMHKELGRQVSYQYLIRLEAYKLIKHLIGEKEYEGFRIWW